jgi:predicted secreted hydrolase
VVRGALVLILILTTVALQVSADSSHFTSAVPGRGFAFPQDHGKHPGFQTEWWYFTGNLDSEPNERWGFQLTFFRRSLLAEPSPRQSSWAVRDLYPAHFALTDIKNQRFFHTDLLSREGPGLADAAREDLNVHVKNWSAKRQGDTIFLKARQEGYALDLRLEPVKPVVLHGQSGFSRKGNAEGQASYYYSFTRVQVSGAITFEGVTHHVKGLAWMDHEFGSSILFQDQAGWNWFSLQLENGTELMLFHLRKKDGTAERPLGTFVPETGTPVDLQGQRIVLTPGDVWKSPHTGARYPLNWTVEIPAEHLTLEVTPLVPDQELTGRRGPAVAYWEGAVTVKGWRNGAPVRGRGYVELTGYARSLGGRL